MGKNFCVCNDAFNNQGTESNIFSGMSNNRHLEKDTIKTLNSVNQVNQTTENKTIQDDNSSNSYNLNAFENEIYKNNYNKLMNNNKSLSKNDNFQCSGKFNILETNPNQQLSNGANEKNENNFSYINDNKNINSNNGIGNIVKKNELGFVSFKSFYDINNNTGEIKENKDNNTNNSIDIKKNNKQEGKDKKNEYDDKQKIEKNSFSICRGNINENGTSKEKNENSDYRYNNISQYSDISDKDYLNNESNYYNSNKREENRENHLLFDEDNQN